MTCVDARSSRDVLLRAPFSAPMTPAPEDPQHSHTRSSSPQTIMALEPHGLHPLGLLSYEPSLPDILQPKPDRFFRSPGISRDMDAGDDGWWLLKDLVAQCDDASGCDDVFLEHLSLFEFEEVD
jgi:hypothetical protein